ncbi:potassium/sodium hyperpolarization-activated cyclic nucleotide-gated channel 1-like isoform X2 [Ornithodoros turicata]|uniref:potassium/sodium hyperpolarization-activated cyclic nucleotide-gated channel 1-like isoform X2 n=1 Tax=Ornithodoros turicata TaxID=34597 RepID=UPI0031397023
MPLALISGKLRESFSKRSFRSSCRSRLGDLPDEATDDDPIPPITMSRGRFMTFDIDHPLHQEKDVTCNGFKASNGDVILAPGGKGGKEPHEEKANQRRQCWFASFFLPARMRRNTKILGSTEAIMQERTRQEESGHWIIHPCSTFRVYWDACMVLLLIVNLIVIPLDVAFFSDIENVGWMTFHLASDAIFFIDIIFNFRTGVVTTEGHERVSLDPKFVAAHYLRSWFVLDFLSTIPFDYLCVVLDHFIAGISRSDGEPDGLSAIRLLHLTKLLGLLKLLRLSRLVRYVRNWEQQSFYFSSGVYVRLFNIVCLMLLIAHWNGCLQFFVAMLQGFPENSWVALDGIQHKSRVEQYSWSMFNAMSQMLSIGYGRNAPVSVIDMWLVSMGMLTGATGYALLIGHATNLIQCLDYSKRLHREKMKQIEEYMQYRRMPKDLRFRVRDYFENRYQGKVFDEDAILAFMSQPLREEVMKHNCRTTIRTVPFLSHADPAFVSDMATRLRYEFFQPGDVIIKEGTLGTKMYFIQTGTVKIVLHGGQFLGTLSEGAYFGEICLLTKTRRNASIVAETYCDMFSLSSEHFNEVLLQYPQMRSSIESLANQRIAQNSTFLSTESEDL